MVALEVDGALTHRLLPCRRDDLDDVREVAGGGQPQEAVGYSVGAVHVALAQQDNLVQELCTYKECVEYIKYYIIMGTLGSVTLCILVL